MPIENNEQYVKFINEYRNLTELWDVNHDKYKNKFVKMKAYEKLLNEYKNIDKNATVETLKKKINNMRIVYRRELKRINDSERRGAGFSDLYVPNLWYFENLSFLRHLERPEPSIYTLSSDDEQSSSKSSTPIVKTRRLSTSRERTNMLYKTLSNIQGKEDEADIYAKSWAVSYRKLSEDQKMIARKVIEESLWLGQKNKLAEDHIPRAIPPQKVEYRPMGHMPRKGYSHSPSGPIHLNQSSSPKIMIAICK